MPTTPFQNLPQEPVIDGRGQMSVMWLRWFEDVYRKFSQAGQVAWSLVNKSGSSLADLATRKHADLTNILGWSSGADTAKDKHISQADGKNWEDHRNDSNIHHTLEQVQDSVAGMLQQGNAVTLTYDDTANTLTVAVVVAEASPDVTTTVTGTAGNTWTATEKDIVNALIADVTALKNGQNDLKAKMRTAGLLAV